MYSGIRVGGGYGVRGGYQPVMAHDEEKDGFAESAAGDGTALQDELHGAFEDEAACAAFGAQVQVRAAEPALERGAA